jgi:amino acid transporter
LLTAIIAIVLAVGFSLSAIASLGSAVALCVFALVSIGHVRVRAETGARAWVLILAVASTLVVLVTFALTTLVEEPGTAIAFVGILALGVLIDFGWKRRRDGRVRPARVQTG